MNKIENENPQKQILTICQANVTEHILETCMDTLGKYLLLINKENGATVTYRNGIELGNRVLYPKDFRMPISTHYASGIEEYGSDRELFDEVRKFIHDRIELEPADEFISTLFVFLTYVKEVLSNTPYIHVLGEYGKGKTTYFKTVGSICYDPITATGGSTQSSIERIVHGLRGTLLLDECDWNKHERKAWYKLLRSGYDRTQPYIKNVQVGKEWIPTEFDVFGSKILVSYERFYDDALNSRCFEVVMKSKTRELISTETPNFMESPEVIHLRNKLLLWKAKNLDKIRDSYDHSLFNDIEASERNKQVMRPLGNIIKTCLGSGSPEFEEILSVLKGLNSRELQRKSDAIEAKLLLVLKELLSRDKITISDIKSIPEFSNLGNQSVGMKLQKLGFDTWKGHNNKGSYYTPNESFKEYLNKQLKEYGIKDTEPSPITEEIFKSDKVTTVTTT